MRRARESLNLIDPVDVKRSYRSEQGFHRSSSTSGATATSCAGLRRQARRRTSPTLTWRSAGSGAGESKDAGPSAAHRTRWARRSPLASVPSRALPIDPPTVDELELRAPRVVVPPDSLGPSSARSIPEERAGHTYGKSFRDVWRALHREFLRSRRIWSPSPATRTTSSRGSGTGAANARLGRHPLRRRVYVGSSAASECDVDDTYAGAVESTSERRPVVGGRPDDSRPRASTGGHYGPALEDAFAAATGSRCGTSRSHSSFSTL
jgi:hypothetical protein